MRIRRRPWRPLLVAVLVLAGAACQPARVDPAEVRRVIVMGDSVAAGLPVLDLPGIATHIPEAYPNAEVVVLGGSGQSPTDGYTPGGTWSTWAGQVNHWLSYGFDADVVVIQGCCNGFTTHDAWRGALDVLIAVARQHDPGGDRRIILAPTPRIVPGTSPYFEANHIDDAIEGSNAVIREIPGVAVADLDLYWSVDWEPVWDVPGLGVVRMPDALHLNALGCRAAAQLIADT